MIAQDPLWKYSAPYPGLRPFERTEEALFFGRADQLAEMLTKLEVHHFLSVVGISGCGKSSLVRAGLIPAIEEGFLSAVGNLWRTVIMRPADAPIALLAEQLSKESGLGRERGANPTTRAMLQATLQRGPTGLVDAVRETHLPEGTNVLLLVDQFEEIFRFRQRGGISQANAFVNLLLAAAQQKDTPIYVVITMRSDFLGDCSVFEGLPETINQSQFLTPRLSRDQLREAIVGPAKVFKSEFEPAAVNRILNDMGTDPDQLPLMQHALMRLWWNVEAGMDREGQASGTPATIKLEDYKATGGLERALSIHANEAYEELTLRQQRIAEVLFRRITDIRSDGRGTRRPVSLGEVATVAEVEPEEVAQVVETFRKPGRSFVTPPVGVPLRQDTVLDISHESFIRQWDKLVGPWSEETGSRDGAVGWLHDEANSASIYRRLAETAKLWKEDKAALWGTPDLELAQDWRETQRPTAAWAERYGGNFDLTMEFLRASEKERQKKLLAEEEAQKAKQREVEAQRRRRHVVVGAIVGAALSLIIAVVAGLVAAQMKTLSDRATASAKVAELRSDESVRQGEIAVQEGRRASRSAYNAQLARFPDVRRNNPERGEPLLQEQSDPDFLDFTWYYYRRLARQVPISIAPDHGALSDVAFSPNGDLVALAGADGWVSIWSVSESRLVSRLPENHMGAVRSIAFGAYDSDAMLASAGDDGSIKLWDFETDEVRSMEGHRPKRVRSLAFSPNGNLLASASDDETIKLWNIESGVELKTLRGHSGWVSCVVFSPDGQTMASASYDTTIRLWNIEDAESWKALQRHTDAVYSVAFSPEDNGKTLASAGEDGTIRLWDMEPIRSASRGQLRDTVVPNAGAVYAVAFSADGTTLASANEDGTTTLWDVPERETSRFRQRFTDHGGAVYSVTFSPKGALATVGSDGKAFVREASTMNEGQITLTAEGGEALEGIAFGSHGNRIAAVDADTVIRIWDLDSQHRADDINLHTAAVTCIASDLSGMTTATGSANEVIVWNIETGQPSHQFDVRSTTAITLSTDGKTLAAGANEGSIRLWKKESAGQPWNSIEGDQLSAEHFNGHRDMVTSLSINHNGTMLASASADQTVRLWDANSGELVTTLAQHGDWVRSVVFSPDGSTLATAGDDEEIRLWNVKDFSSADPKSRKTLTGHTGGVTSMAFSPDGQTLASASVDTTIMLWDAQLGDWRGTLRGHTGPVRFVTFRQDGRMLFSTGDDGTIRIWDARSEETESR